MLAIRRALVGLIAIGVVAAAVLAFVTFREEPSAASDSASPRSAVIANSMASAGAPASFRNRPTFRSCGEVVLAQGVRIPQARIRCLAAAPAEGRELVIASPTTEGDPIVRYYRTGPDLDGVEIVEDATRDRFGGGWHRSLCRSGRIDQTGACA
ncbi:hypothetical protein [uncultured Amnibacterium sp.]|uniref:hypothetical protein n=1 Tax=uncultured Amnibacterium sp. TaxID=1631851 RepID=UPI0035CBD87D